MSGRQNPAPPAYRRHKRGRRDSHEYAYVTLRDAVTGKRQDYSLGEYGSPESRERYLRLLAEWEQSGRRLPGVPLTAPAPTAGPSVNQLCHAYWADKDPHCGAKHMSKVSMATRILRQFHGSSAAASLGPNALRLVRQAMVDGDANAEPKPRKPWSRTTVNQLTRCIVSIYKWGVAHELIPAQVYEALRTIEPLKYGQTTARETEPVRPVPDQFVDAALPHMLPQVRAMVELQRTTGMRPGEVVIMRTCDLDTGSKVWVYTPARHKTAYRGHRRIIRIGPRGQEILKPWLRANLEEYLFQPAEAMEVQRARRREARKTAESCGNRPGTNRKADPKRVPADRYTTVSYRRAIERACDAADEEARKETKNGERLVPRWTPHQLRHNYATAVRARFGVEASRIVLGHQHIDVTELYAERDQAVAERVAKALG